MSYHGAAGAVAQTASISLAREVGVFLSWQSIAAKNRVAIVSGTTTAAFELLRACLTLNLTTCTTRQALLRLNLGHHRFALCVFLQHTKSGPQ
jgi:hypothetical protein